ncbi:MAG: hypothetical protein M3R00_07540, partial [Pseudomonadota bacterium]|nr:hypothetical protein [Pseudomonadota bacterium]
VKGDWQAHHILSVTDYKAKLRGLVAQHPQEFAEFIKDSNARQILWFISAHGYNHGALMAFFDHQDIRDDFFSKKKDANWPERVMSYLNAAPALAVWFMQDKDARALIEPELTKKLNIKKIQVAVKALVTVHDARKPFNDIIDKLVQQFEKYSANRKTDGFFYNVGVYNVELSKHKNQLVAHLTKNAKDTRHSIEDVAYLANNLAKVLKQAIQTNEAYYARYGRKVDGKGALGKEMRRAVDTLENFAKSQVVKDESPRCSTAKA